MFPVISENYTTCIECEEIHSSDDNTIKINIDFLLKNVKINPIPAEFLTRIDGRDGLLHLT